LDQDLLWHTSQKVFSFCAKGKQTMNRLKTLMLLAALTALLLWAGQALAGQAGFLIALVLAGAMNFAGYWWSDRLVLRMHGAEEVSAQQAPELHAMVRELVARAGLPMPRVYLIPEEAPNAFATGRNPEHAAVAVTAGLLRLLNREELKGVLAHELGHVRNRDTLIMVVAATIAGALSWLAQMTMFSSLMGGRSDEEQEEGSPLGGLLAVIIAPIAAALIQMAISRSREFLADEAGARLTGNPLALGAALRKIESWGQQSPMQTGSPATAHMFIINPLAGGAMLKLFSTHPSTAARIARLEAMAIEGAALNY
jgi:heat shock protein HtpX